MTGGPDGFEKNVFINCPFDSEYVEGLLKPLLYTLSALGFRPRIARERADAGEQRLLKICDLISCSRFSIHDLSRLRAEEEGEFYRLNMPFELGIDYGSRKLAGTPYDSKRFLILETEPYRYMRALSDLNGVDIEAHEDDPKILIRKVRHWLRTATGQQGLQAPAAIWYQHQQFVADLYNKLNAKGFSDDDIQELPVVEYLEYVRRWLQAKA